MPQHIATEDIRVSAGVYAHRKGDVVPEQNIKRNGWESKVAPVTEKSAEKSSDKSKG